MRPHPEPSPWSARDTLAALLLCALHALTALRFWFVTDDAFITFRFSKNLAAGLGPRFNAGAHEPVEGYSNFLWMLLGGAFEALGLSLEFWPNVVSIACGCALVALIYRCLRCRLALGLPVAVVGALFAVLHPPFALWSTGGLATMPYALLVFLLFDRLVLAPRIAVPSTIVVAGATALIRAEGIAWVFVLLAMGWVARRLDTAPRSARPMRPLFVVGLGASLLFAAFELWRWSYYGDWLPNTIRAKEGLSPERLERGFDYVAVQFLSQLTPFVVLFAAPCALRSERRSVGLPILAMAVAFPTYAVVTSGDYMAMGRFLLPSWAFCAVLFAWFFHDLRTRAGAVPAAIVAGLVLALGTLPGFDRQLVPPESLRAFHFRHNQDATEFRSEYQQWQRQQRVAIRRGIMGRAMARWIEPDEKLVSGTIGAVGYYSDLFIYDKNGLVTREVALRQPPPGSLRSPGHDKAVPDAFFLDDPAYAPTVVGYKLMTCRQPLDARGPEANKARAQLAARIVAHDEKSRPDFVADFFPIPESEGLADTYLVFRRRVQPTERVDAERERLLARLKKLHRGEDPNRDVVHEGWPPRAFGLRQDPADWGDDGSEEL